MSRTGIDVIEGFGGPGGWAEGLRMLGRRSVGVEWDAAACATRAAAGHPTIRADVTRMPLDHLAGRVEGVILSPPCQAFSAAGNGDGRAELDRLAAAIRAGQWDATIPHSEVLEVGRWAETLRPGWVACEQVPPVLPLWRSYVARWRAMGWAAWAGLLCAADYGVPQTRTRAFLLARPDGRAVHPPAATHCRGGGETLFGGLAPWVSMAEALGWDGEDQPARTLCGDRSPRWLYPDPAGTHGRTVVRTQNRQGNATGRVDYERSIDEPAPTLTGIAGAKSQWVWERPATTVCGDPRLSFPGHHDEDHRGTSADEGSVKLTLTEALILQSFRPDYPVQGTKTKQFEQVRNAVPPLLAAHVLGAVIG